jgi:hypothetical protein
MNSIKDVQVLEKTEAEKASFYRYMNIDPSIGKIISTPKELLSKIDLKSTEEHVLFLPNNGKKIFFSSKGKDGLSGKDIYMTSRVNGAFTPPVKLKSTVNTEFDEDFAFMHPNGSTLYFASKGHGSMGGYDIFRCEWDAAINDFGPAINMDFAINTPDDDLFFITDSLNTTAYFASSRLTSPDKLYVYRVFVIGIPMNITYLKGEFISRVDATQTEAKIQVFDDLTNRKIMDTQARESNGQFLLFIPTAGNYTYKIQPPGSPQIHEVQVKIPPTEGSRVFRQEIVYSKTDGREKVEVKNYWNDPLNDNVEDLQRQMLLAKSQLDVNATVDQSAFASSNSSSNNSTAENYPNPSGTNQRIEIDTVLSSQEKTIAALKLQIAEAEETSKLLLQFVQQTLSETDEAYEEFQTVRFEKAESLADSAKLIEARSNMIATQDRSVAAIAAYDISKNREQELKRKLDDIQKTNAQIKQSLAEKDSPMAAYLVNDYVAKNPKSEQGIVTEVNPTWESQTAKAKVSSNKAKADDSQLRLNTKLKEIEELEAKANEVSKQMSSTKKKKDIERLGNELNTIESEFISVKEEIESEKENLRVHQLELQESITLLKLLQDLENEKQPEVKPEFKNLGNTVNVESLKSEISESKTRVSTALENYQYENPDNANNASSNNASSNNDSSNNSSSNNASSNNASSNNDSSNNDSSNNDSSNNASSNNSSSNNASSNNASSNNASSNNASSNNASSNNASSNNASSNSASSNNASSNNASSNNASSNNASSNNASSNNASSRTFTIEEESILNSPGQSNYRDEQIFTELENAEIQVSNRKELERIYLELESIDTRLKSEDTTPEIKAQLTAQRKQLMFEKMQEEDKNSLIIAEHNSNELIDLQSAWKKNISSANTIATPEDKKTYENTLAYMKEANELRSAAKDETDIFERYAKNARAFALERNAKNELQFLVEKTTPSNNTASSNNASSNNASSNNASSNNASSNNASSNNASSNNASSNNASSNNASSNNASSNNSSSNNASSNNASSNNASSNNASSNNASSKNTSSNNASSNNASSNNSSSNNASSNNASSNNASSNNASSNNASSNNASSNNASSNNASSNNASSFTSIPKIVQATLYHRQTTSAYSDANPIPIGLPLPEGSFYTIQVGAFRLPVANNTFSQFAPVYAERQSNGFIRYSTGFFTSYTEAIQARNEIRQMGYADAFIVAYKNRERVRYSELMTAEEKANPNAVASNTPPVTTPIVTAPDVTYYSDPLAVPANLIEKTEGVFFTVQVGVYAKPSRNTVLNTYTDLHVEKLPNGQVRYTSGKFQTIAEVVKQRDFCRANGIPDAFITAYKDGKRITVPEGKKELGIQ